MNLVVTLSSLDDIKILSESGADTFVLGNEKFANRLVNSYTSTEISEANDLIKSLSKKIYINANLIVHNNMLEEMNEHLKFIKTLNVDGIVFGDMGVYVLAKKLAIEHLLIYNPETLNTNYYDPIFWSRKGIKGITISKELTLEDILVIAKDSPIETSIIGHGHLNMFHSRRPLIENYFKHNEQDPNEYINNRNLTLVEEIRNEAYPVFQDSHGTHIFRKKAMQSFKEANALKGSLNDFYIYGIFKDSQYVVEIVKVYREILDHEDQQFIDDKILKFKENHDAGFLYKKTVYDKY